MTVQELATLVGGTVVGEGSRRLVSCADLSRAAADQLSFLYNIKYTKHLETTHAGCVILAPDVASRLERKDLTVIIARDPYFAWRQALMNIYGDRRHPAVGTSPAAFIHPTAHIGKNVNIHPFVSIGENVTIGDNTTLYPSVTIMANTHVGNDCILYPAVSVYDNCVIGNRVILHAGCVIGVDGYGFATHAGAHHKIPQVGNVLVEDDVEIGANTNVERAVMDSTIIAKGTKIGGCVIVGHNSRIGQHNLLVSQVGIAGSTSTGKYVAMGGQAGVAGHLHIADMTRIAAQSGIVADIDEPGLEFGGSPAMEGKHARRVYLQFAQLPDIAKRLRELEAQVKKLQQAADAKAH